MIVHLLDPAQDELAGAIAFYDSRHDGRGDKFLLAVREAFKEIGDHPYRAPEVEPGVRRKNMSLYPYAIIYQVEGDEVRVGSIMHGHREPGYWRGRF